jgi:hypothetical protein
LVDGKLVAIGLGMEDSLNIFIGDDGKYKVNPTSAPDKAAKRDRRKDKRDKHRSVAPEQKKGIPRPKPAMSAATCSKIMGSLPGPDDDGNTPYLDALLGSSDRPTPKKTPAPGSDGAKPTEKKDTPVEKKDPPPAKKSLPVAKKGLPTKKDSPAEKEDAAANAHAVNGDHKGPLSGGTSVPVTFPPQPAAAISSWADAEDSDEEDPHVAKNESTATAAAATAAESASLVEDSYLEEILGEEEKG